MKQQKQKEQNISEADATIATFQTGQDVKTAILIVSVFANLLVFIVWLLLQLTSRYDTVMTSWLIG